MRRMLTDYSSRSVGLRTRLLERSTAGGGIGEDPGFARLWQSMWTEIASVVRPEVAPKLASIQQALEGRE